MADGLASPVQPGGARVPAVGRVEVRTFKVLSPRLMKALAIVLEVLLGVVIVMFLLGLFEVTTTT